MDKKIVVYCPGCGHNGEVEMPSDNVGTLPLPAIVRKKRDDPPAAAAVGAKLPRPKPPTLLGATAIVVQPGQFVSVISNPMRVRGI